MHHRVRSATVPFCIRRIGIPSLLCLLSIPCLAAQTPSTQPSPATQPTGLRLAPIFTDNMVLQRDIPLPIFGFSSPRDFIVVTLAGQTRAAIADKDGKWIVHFDPLHAGGPTELSVTGHEAGHQKTITLINILIGEVWVCSGQSNMELLVKSCTNAKEEIAAAAYPRIRINSSSGSFAKASGRGWVECGPACIANCSAVGYFFGRELHRDLNVPIGLVIRAVGGTVIKQWAPKSGDLIEHDPDLRFLNTEWRLANDTYSLAQNEFKEWQATTRAAQSRGLPLPKGPPMPLNPKAWGGAYESQIAPLMPFAIRGVIWYQGETDARTAREIQQFSTLPAMIKSWRKAWGQGDFPFLLVQLANDWGGNGASKPPSLPPIPPENHHWPWVREAQALACRLLPNTAMACTIDLGGKIHYPGKQDVGRRLAHVAEAQVYGLPVVATGPVYDAMTIEDNTIRLRFKSIGHGLIAKGSEELIGFAIAGADHHFVWAHGQIDGDSVLVSNPSIAHPLAVRYDWLNDPHGNLYNSAGLPTAPFRTDDWMPATDVRTATAVVHSVNGAKKGHEGD